MITWELILAISAYNFVMYVTPGPNNAMLTASGIPVRYVGKSNIFNSPGARSLISYLSIIGPV